MLREHPRQYHDPVQILLKDTPFNPELILPLERIRHHTKTEDILTVTDDQLEAYRAAALEAAQEYTGILMSGKQHIEESVEIPGSVHTRRRPYFWHETRRPFAEPFAYLYGHKQYPAQKLRPSVGETRIKLPVLMDDFGLGCCNPCFEPINMKLHYVAGFGCEKQVPSQIALGALKAIAHMVENPGDLVIATSETGGPRTGVTVADANNPYLASGAIEIWRVVKQDAI